MEDERLYKLTVWEAIYFHKKKVLSDEDFARFRKMWEAAESLAKKNTPPSFEKVMEEMNGCQDSN